MPIKDPEKQRQAQKEWYQRNRERMVQKAVDKRKRVRKWIEDYKNNKPCLDCKQVFPYYCLDFDHRPGTTKVGDIGRLVLRAGFKGVQDEIAKCDLVCSNCHRIRTFTRMRDKSETRAVSDVA